VVEAYLKGNKYTLHVLFGLELN